MKKSSWKKNHIKNNFSSSYYDFAVLNFYDHKLEADRIKIGNNVWIGANVIILLGVSIGSGSVLGAGSVVTKSLPENVVAVGNPAHIVKYKQIN